MFRRDLLCHGCGGRGDHAVGNPLDTEGGVRASHEVRWMSISDAPHIATMSYNCHAPFDGCDEKEIIETLASAHGAGMIALVDGETAGFVIYEAHKTRYHILDICVAPQFRRRGVATELIDRLVLKLKNTKRCQILAETDDEDLGTHLFFKSAGFRAIRVMKNYFHDPDQDAYLFQFRNPNGLVKGKR